MFSLRFNLVVRNNLRQTQDDFEPGDVRRFDDLPVRCGSGTDCRCQVERDVAVADGAWFELASLASEGGIVVVPLLADGVFINDSEQPLSAVRKLISGDSIRVGHYTFRFQRARRSAETARKSDAMATLAKVILVAIFVSQAGLVYWLPRQLQRSRLLAVNVLRYKTVRELDSLRAKAKLGGDEAAGSLPALARTAVAEELDDLAAYVRRTEKVLSGEQWQSIRATVVGVGKLLAQAEDGQIGKPLPALEIDLAVERILEKHDVEIPSVE